MQMNDAKNLRADCLFTFWRHGAFLAAALAALAAALAAAVAALTVAVKFAVTLDSIRVNESFMYRISVRTSTSDLSLAVTVAST